MNNKLAITLTGLILILGIAYFVTTQLTAREPAVTGPGADGTPYNVTLSGTYTCLPHAETSGPQTMECAFGLKTDDGDYYAVNFGASANAATQFQSGAHIRAEGNVVIKEALNSDQWQKYNMKGIFTVTNMLEVSEGTGSNPSAAPNAKININAVCDGALAYMSFPDGASADAFVAECKEGKHPEVIEHYKAQLNAGDGAVI